MGLQGVRYWVTNTMVKITIAANIRSTYLSNVVLSNLQITSPSVSNGNPVRYQHLYFRLKEIKAQSLKPCSKPHSSKIQIQDFNTNILIAIFGSLRTLVLLKSIFPIWGARVFSKLHMSFISYVCKRDNNLHVEVFLEKKYYFNALL